MSRDDITTKLTTIIIEQFGIDADQVTPETRFAEDLNADSLDRVELIMAVEEDFGINIDDEEVAHLQTVGQAVDWLEVNIAE